MRIEQNLILNQSELLVTKLTAPVQRSKIVKRPRLTDLLRAGMAHKLTTIIAPAGYGKTTLLREWLSSLEGSSWPVAWVSLDDGDNNYLQFWSYIVGALKAVEPDLTQGLLNFRVESGSENDFRPLTPLINQIAAISRHFSLVLDDYQVITSPVINRSVAYLVERMPVNMHLIIASRVILPFSISRLRVQKQLVEINPPDLSFTYDETKIFLETIMELAASSEDIGTLNHLTEGWAAGLQLAALSVKGKNVKSFLDNYAGSNRHILDFFTDEILNQLDGKSKDFLIKTSIFTSFTAPLSDHVLDISNSQEILQGLEKRNIMIVPLDEHRQWYRYHALFADALRVHLRESCADVLPKMHLSACSWLEQHGYPELAIPQALAAGDHERAAEIVESCALQSVIQFNMLTVMQWIDRLPQEVYEKRPRLSIYYALANLLPGHIGEVEKRLKGLTRILENTRVSEAEYALLKRQAFSIYAALICVKGDYERGIDALDQAFAGLKAEDMFLLGMVKHFSQYAYIAMGRLAEAEEAIRYAIHNAMKHKYEREYIGSSLALARFFKYQGKLDEALQIYQSMIETTKNTGLDEEIIRIAQVGLADVYREKNDLDTACELACNAEEYFSKFGISYLEWYYSPDLTLLLARNHFVQGNFDKVENLVELTKEKIRNYYEIPYLQDLNLSILVKTWIAKKDYQKVENWANEVQRRLSGEGGRVSVIEKIELARVFTELGKYREAVDLLQDLNLDEPPIMLAESRIETYLLQATAYECLGKKINAVQSLLKAVELAAPGGYVRVFVDMGVRIQNLLADALDELAKEQPENQISIFSNYIQTLISSFDVAPPQQTSTSTETVILDPLLEQLSEREMDVLRLLAAGMSSKQIASKLVISVNTTRTHIKNIYQKLDVHRREEAIEKALKFQII